MSVVAFAFGLGLHLQFGIEGQAALITAAVVWTALLVMHLLVRRAHVSKGSGAAEGGGAAAEEPKQVPAKAPPRWRTRAAVSRDPPPRSKPPPLPVSARGPALPQPGAEAPSDAPRDRLPPELQPMRPTGETKDERRLPPEMGWDLRPGAQRAPLPSTPQPAVFPPLEEPAATARKEAGWARPPRPESAVGDSHYPGALAQPPAAQPEAGGGERSMQSIIDQLARQLKAPADADAGSASNADPQAGTEQAITRSIEALKAAGGAMRAAHAGGQTAPVTPQPATGASSAAADTALPHTAQAQPSAPAVADAVARQSLEVCLDSILSLDDRKTRHFEMSVRMRLGAGQAVPIDDYALVQAGEGLRGRLDAAKLARVARIAGPLSKRGLSAALFVNLAAESLVDDTFLDACASIVTEQPNIVHQLVPSFSQGEIRSFAKPHWETLATLKENGLRFGVERLGDLAMDFAILKERGFHFAKIDAGVLLGGMQAHDGPVSALQVCQRLAEAGLDLIVTRIDDDATLAQIGSLGVLFGQGTFFGVPRPVKIDLKAPEEAAA